MAAPSQNQPVPARARPGHQPIVRGWINYYGRFYRSRLSSTVLRQVNEYLIRWAMSKHKRMRRSPLKAARFLARITRSDQDLFAHWKLASVKAG